MNPADTAGCERRQGQHGCPWCDPNHKPPAPVNAAAAFNFIDKDAP